MHFISLLFLTGCQSHKKAIQYICEAPKDCADWLTASPDVRITALYKHIEQKVSNREAKDMLLSLAPLSNKDKASVIQKSAQKESIKRCIFAEMLIE